MPLQGFTFKCRECGTTKTLQLHSEDVQRWRNGALIQRVFPQLSEGDRELMISQTCGKCFDELFADPEDEEPELSKIRQDSESLPSYFLRGYDCEHKRLSPDGDCLDCGS